MKIYIPLSFFFFSFYFVAGQSPSKGFEGCLTDEEKIVYQELMARKTNSLAKQFLALSIYKNSKDLVRYNFTKKAISKNFFKGSGSNGTITHQFPQNSKSTVYGVEQFCTEFYKSDENASIYWYNTPGAGIIRGTCIPQVKDTKLKIYKECPVPFNEIYSFGNSKLEFSKQVEFRIYEGKTSGAWKLAVERVVTTGMFDPEKNCRKSDPKGDADGDGIINKKDKCCLRPGPKSNKGCPLPGDDEKCLRPDQDDDGDGIENARDNCCKVPGHEELGGCPRDTIPPTSFSRLSTIEPYVQPQLKRLSHRSSSTTILQPNVVGVAIEFFNKKDSRLSNSGVRLSAEMANYSISNLANTNGMFLEEIRIGIDEIRVSEINAALLWSYNLKNNNYTYNPKITNRFGFNLNIGPQLNILNDVDHFYQGEELNNVIDPINNRLSPPNKLRNTINYSGVLQIGSSYAFSQKLFLNISAISSYRFRDIDNKSFNLSGKMLYPTQRGKTSDLSMGLQLGFSYKFLNSKNVNK